MRQFCYTEQMNEYQKVVLANDLNPKQIADLFQQLLERLKLEIVMEKTPDYTAFEIVEKV